MILVSYPCFYTQFANKFDVPVKLLLENEPIGEQVSKANVIIFSGGEDLNPYLYGEANKSSGYNPERDAMEYSLLASAIQQKKYILGTCRGLQLINVFFGGTLYQDISIHHTNTGFIWRSKILESMFPVTNSMHHQGINQLASDFIPLGFTRDNLIEAIFSSELRTLAFQFHPELIASPFWKRMENPESLYRDIEEEYVRIHAD